MKQIIEFIGSTRTGKTTSLLERLALDRKDLDNPSTLLIVLDDEIDKYKSILPNGTYIKENEIVDAKFNTIVIDSTNNSNNTDLLTKAKKIYIASQTPIEIHSKAS